MRAAVYTGGGTLSVEYVPTQSVGPGELLVRVESCGVCHTDLKKIEFDLLPPPSIYGHETAGVVVQAGPEVAAFRPGDRVIVFHHVPCRECFYCRRKLFAQCSTYKKVGVTAGFEPAGGGFSQYVRVMDWIVRGGVEKIPDGVGYDRACFVEPVNTCHKAVMLAAPLADETVLVLGQGPIGLLFTMLCRRSGARVFSTDTIPARRDLSVRSGAAACWDPLAVDVCERVREETEGRGADLVIVASSAPSLPQQAIRCSRPGSRVLFFAQTSHQERIDISGADICMGERTIFGCYSASIDLQKESAELVFSGAMPVETLISHRFPLDDIGQAIRLASHPDGQSLKIIVEPQRSQ